MRSDEGPLREGDEREPKRHERVSVAKATGDLKADVIRGSEGPTECNVQGCHLDATGQVTITVASVTETFESHPWTCDDHTDRILEVAAAGIGSLRVTPADGEMEFVIVAPEPWRPEVV